MISLALLPHVEEFVGDIRQLVNVVLGAGSAMEAQAGGVVPAGVSSEKPETLVPLALAVVLMFFYLQAIETFGYMVASALQVGGGKNADPKRRERKRERFCTAWGEAVYFAIQVFINYRLFGAASWYWPSNWELLMDDGRKATFLGGTSALPYHCTREMRAYYVLEFGWYAMNLVMLFFKRRRSDFNEMLAHHVITSTLIFVSYSFGFFRIGIVVMNLHNLFDPFLNIAKCCHYAFTGGLHVLADISFAIGAIVFLVSRLIMYPYAIYHAWLFTAGNDPIWDASGDEWACKILLCLLYPIHIFWFWLILKVAKKALMAGEAQGDERSDSEDEDEEPDDGKREKPNEDHVKKAQ